jgi:hypothetical protein
MVGQLQPLKATVKWSSTTGSQLSLSRASRRAFRLVGVGVAEEGLPLVGVAVEAHRAIGVGRWATSNVTARRQHSKLDLT